MTKCYSCDNESKQGARACQECIDKAGLEVIETCKQGMNSLDNSLHLCESEEEYKRNREAYDRYRKEILYNTKGINGIPRLTKRKVFRNGLYA